MIGASNGCHFPTCPLTGSNRESLPPKPTYRYLSDEVAGSDLALMFPGNLIRDPGSETAWVALPVSDISSFWEALSGIEETEHLRPFTSPGSGQGRVNRFKHDETGLERGREYYAVVSSHGPFGNCADFREVQRASKSGRAPTKKAVTSIFPHVIVRSAGGSSRLCASLRPLTRRARS